MSTVLMAALALAVPPGKGDSLSGVAAPPAAASAQPAVAGLTGVELREAVRKALRRWARPSDEDASAAACEFLVLYDELRRDDKLALTQRAEYRTKVRGRLMSLSVQIKKRAAIQRRLAKAKGPNSVDAVAELGHVLAQLGGGFGGQGAGGFGGGMMGGAGMMAGGFGGGPPGANDDDGEQLVELIQQTISPKSWDVNGGPGSIYYWRPGRAIVVRQTGEVHGRIGNVLQQMGNVNR